MREKLRIQRVNGQHTVFHSICSKFVTNWNYSPHLDMVESRLGLGRKSARRLWLWEEGRMRVAKARFTRSPSTPPILTSEFVIADLRALRRFCEYGADEVDTCEPNPLCRLHRKEPGCDVGEHIHVRLGLICFFIALRWWLLLPCGVTEMERLGEVGRSSIENRTD